MRAFIAPILILAFTSIAAQAVPEDSAKPEIACPLPYPIAKYTAKYEQIDPAKRHSPLMTISSDGKGHITAWSNLIRGGITVEDYSSNVIHIDVIKGKGPNPYQFPDWLGLFLKSLTENPPKSLNESADPTILVSWLDSKGLKNSKIVYNPGGAMGLATFGELTNRRLFLFAHQKDKSPPISVGEKTINGHRCAGYQKRSEGFNTVVNTPMKFKETMWFDTTTDCLVRAESDSDWTGLLALIQAGTHIEVQLIDFSPTEKELQLDQKKDFPHSTIDK